ncbi:iron-sulfur cluster assembly accessory protein [bacterium]|nr:MAG: iron-sulfur cluster assembly accessory protein [bacterium]
MSDLFVFTPVAEPIKISDSASKQLQKVLSDNSEADKVLRIGVKGGGCSGMSYILELDNKTDYDDVYTVNGVEFVLDRRHLLYIEGTELQFSDGLDNRGFEFVNPNATETCGCGTSFKA